MRAGGMGVDTPAEDGIAACAPAEDGMAGMHGEAITEGVTGSFWEARSDLGGLGILMRLGIRTDIMHPMGTMAHPWSFSNSPCISSRGKSSLITGTIARIHKLTTHM